MQKCKHCSKDYEPKPQYCSTKGRVYHNRNSTDTKRNDNVTKEHKPAVTNTLQSVTQVIQKSNASVTKQEDTGTQTLHRESELEIVKSKPAKWFDTTMCVKH